METLNLAEYLKDEDKLLVPQKGADEVSVKEKVEKATTKETKVNINKASQTDLESIPGVGAQTARRIIEHRKSNGAFKTI